ncbi:MAG: type II toxin-antitoxin system VapC family toxin, partial [Thiothrix sp.]
KDAQKQMQSFVAFAEQCEILPLTVVIADKTAELYAQLRKQGTPVDDIDLLIAGTALTHQRVIITNNTKHFQRIPTLHVEDWSV